MSGRFFVDTNIFVYSFDRTASKKRIRAMQVIEEALRDGRGVISYQVIQEFLSAATKKFKTAMNLAEIREYLNLTLLPMCEINSGAALFRTAIDIQNETGYSFYDSLIVAAAATADCGSILSEDLQAGRIVRGILIRNPFLAEGKS